MQRRVRYKESFIDLTPQEFSLLYVLTQAAGSPLSRSDLLKRAWPDAIDNPRTVDTHVLSLRKKKSKTILANPASFKPYVMWAIGFNLDRLSNGAVTAANKVSNTVTSGSKVPIS